MSVALLPTRAALRWEAAEASLREVVPAAGHPLITTHAAAAQDFLHQAGRPTLPWANRIAAIAVIALRRADTAPTMGRRAAYLDVAAAASDLLLLGEHLHGVHPDEQARAVLSQTGFGDRESVLI